VKILQQASLLVNRDLTLGTVAERLARLHGNRRLVEEPGGGLAVTHRQAAKRVSRWAGGIAAQVAPGDTVVVATPNGYEQLLLCMAASRAGAIPVPVNDQMRRDEVAHVVEDSGAALVIRSAIEVDGSTPLDQAVPASPDDLAALFYTSGTTGTPKGVELTHRAMIGQVATGAAWPSSLRRDEAVVSLPIAHIMGFAAALGMACAGIPVYFLPHFHPVAVLDAIEDRRATIFLGVPAMYRMLLEAGAEERDLRSVRLWASGADSMPGDLAARFKKLGATTALPVIGPIGEAMFAEGYGMVESGGGVAAKVSPPFLDVGLGESVGWALPGYRFKVVGDDGQEVPVGQVGELLVRGPGLLRGYRGDPAATESALTADGWLHTGDLARRGPFRLVMFAGRMKDVVMHGGYSVYAVEVERTLEEHPEVLEAVVIALPDPRHGEVPAAAVRLADGSDLESLDLRAWAAERLAEYKVPKRYVAVDELPRTGTRKVQKQELRALFD
jgi:acyl-CoA synthetase (AMP-forming)/AMP-acid ligase II